MNKQAITPKNTLTAIQNRQKMTMKVCVLFLALMLFSFHATTVYAYAPPVEEVVEEENDLTPMQDPLTPEGNLTLVDDIFTNNEGDKQFITAVSKNGNWFYLVIDRAGDNNNVYLLNMVDEADLMALMLDEEVTYDFGEEEEIIVPEPEPEPEPEPVVTVEPTKESNTIPMLGLLALGGGAAFYFLKVKPSQTPQTNNLFDDLDLDEDEPEEKDED